MKLCNGEVLVGEWKAGVLHGNGVHKFNDGSGYFGQFKYGKKEGLGIMGWQDRDYFLVGEWRDDKMNGKGTYVFKDGTSSSGIWINGVQVANVPYNYVNNFLNSPY